VTTHQRVAAQIAVSVCQPSAADRVGHELT